MRRRACARARGEGYTEYVIVLSVVMVCALVGLITAGSATMKKIYSAAGICDGCPKTEIEVKKPEETKPPSSGAVETPAPTSGPEAPPSGSGTPSESPGTIAGTTPGTIVADADDGIFSRIWRWFGFA